MSNINLLPWRDAAKERTTKVFYFSVIASAVAAAGITFIANSYVSHLTDVQRQRNQYLTREISILDSQIGQINKIKSEKKLLTEKMTLINDLQKSRNISVKLMNKLPEVISTGVYLKKLNFNGSSLETSGQTEAYSRVATTMRQIESTGWLGHVNIQNITSNEKDNQKLSDFALTFNIIKDRME